MRIALKALGLGLVVAAAAAFVALDRAGAQDGQPDIGRSWAGKLLYKDNPMDAEGDGGKGAFDAWLSVGQEGSSIAATLYVDTDEGFQSFNLQGQIGNGHFWLSNGDTENPMLLTGHVSGSGERMKLKVTGIFVDGGNISDIKFAMKPGSLPG